MLFLFLQRALSLYHFFHTGLPIVWSLFAYRDALSGILYPQPEFLIQLPAFHRLCMFLWAVRLLSRYWFQPLSSFSLRNTWQATVAEHPAALCFYRPFGHLCLIAVSAWTFPPHALHWTSGKLLWVISRVFQVIPLVKQLRIGGSQVIIPGQHRSVGTNRAICSFYSGMNNGLPFISALSAFPPYISAWLFIDCIRH